MKERRDIFTQNKINRASEIVKIIDAEKQKNEDNPVRIRGPKYPTHG